MFRSRILVPGESLTACCQDLNRSGCKARSIRAPARRGPALKEKGSIDSMPLKAQVQAKNPKTSPSIACQRFCPEYGIRFDGSVIHTPMIKPSADVAAPMPEAQITILLHNFPFWRSGVK